MTKKDLDGNGDRSDTAYKIASAVINACVEAKGRDISVLDVSKIFSLSDYFVIVSGRSDRQVQGITNKILTCLEESGLTPFSVEGEEKAHWVLLDYGEVVVHVFYEPVRVFYDLDSLWSHSRKVDLTKELIALESTVKAA
jgi:ribosome-associated protein